MCIPAIVTTQVMSASDVACMVSHFVVQDIVLTAKAASVVEFVTAKPEAPHTNPHTYSNTCGDAWLQHTRQERHAPGTRCQTRHSRSHHIVVAVSTRRDRGPLGMPTDFVIRRVHVYPSSWHRTIGYMHDNEVAAYLAKRPIIEIGA